MEIVRTIVVVVLNIGGSMPKVEDESPATNSLGHLRWQWKRYS